MDSPSPTGGSLLLVSDLDDTIKISCTTSKLVTVYRGLFRSSAFVGMAQLYEEMLRAHPGSEFYIVSSSPPAIRKRIVNFLGLNGFPKAELVLRDWVRQPNVLEYKKKSIAQLIERAPHPVILIGDDTEHDPEVFAEMFERHPGKVVARYVRAVRGRALPKGSIEFYTAFDIACVELAAGRLQSTQVLRVGEAVLQNEKNSRLIPWFSLKPPLAMLPSLTGADESVLELWKKVHAKVQAIPRRRTKS